jgi:signal transduction histidine kinase
MSETTTLCIALFIALKSWRCWGRLPLSVSVKLDIPETLPALRVDVMQIQQVFRNLISNGVEAIPDGGTLAISAVENRQDRTVPGSGITPEVLPVITSFIKVI